VPRTERALSGGPFTRRGAAWVAGAATASLAAAGFLAVFGGALFEPPSFGADSFSRSAVGHRAFVELLRGLGHPLLVSRHDTADKARDGAVIALLEPRVGPRDSARERILEEMSDAAQRLLVVLPKRGAFPDPARPRLVARADLLAVAEVQRVLEALDLAAEVVRPERPVAGWRGDLPHPSIDRPQLLVSGVLEPLLASDEGILVGEARGGERRMVVLADPDVLATHGLGLGENAVLAVRLVERLSADGLPVVVDETLHGFDERPSLARELLRYPLALATASALLAGALLAWAALVRFGRPRPPGRALAAGKLFLVDSTAALLRLGGDPPAAAAAYLRAAKDEVAQRLRPPGEAAAPGAWLARTAEARGAAEALGELEERVRRLAARRGRADEEAVRVAQAIHRWREEMTDGADGDPRRDRAAQG
jgi:hypothetical protein